MTQEHEGSSRRDEPPAPEDLLHLELLVPIRSSSGQAPDPTNLAVDALRHGTDADGGRFVAAFTSQEMLAEYGPPGTDHVRMSSRALFERADRSQERVVIDPGAPGQLELSPGAIGFLAAGIDPTHPEVLRSMGSPRHLPPLTPPTELPEPFGTELRRALDELTQVTRAWLLRAGTEWTIGVEMVPDAVLGQFDEIRNRLHAVASEHLGSRRRLAVTDLRAVTLRAEYDAVAAPFYVRPTGTRGLLSRLLGR